MVHLVETALGVDRFGAIVGQTLCSGYLTEFGTGVTGDGQAYTGESLVTCPDCLRLMADREIKRIASTQHD